MINLPFHTPPTNLSVLWTLWRLEFVTLFFSYYFYFVTSVLFGAC